jgi:hypothetical protein
MQVRNREKLKENITKNKPINIRNTDQNYGKQEQDVAKIVMMGI